MAPLTPEEEKWIEINCQYWQIEPVNIRVSPSVHDIAYSNGTILLGKKFLNGNPGSFVRRQKLSHELLHHLGFPHDRNMTAIGYYSNPKKDRFSKRLVKDIEEWYSGMKPHNPYRDIQGLRAAMHEAEAGLPDPHRDFQGFRAAMHEASLPATRSMWEAYRRSEIDDPIEWYRFFVRSGGLYNPERYRAIIAGIILLSIVTVLGRATTL